MRLDVTTRNVEVFESTIGQGTGYDSLNRLISAQSGSTWGQGFQYDGFGNLTAKTVLAGSVPTLSVGVDPNTNRMIGQSYDNNGNMLSSPSGMTLAYDAENRMTVAQSTSSGMQYAYDEQNKRIWGCPISPSSGQCAGQQIVYFYGLNGKLLAQYNAQYTGPTGINGNLTPTLTMIGPSTRLYFGSRMLGNEDRLSSHGRYYPYGEDRPPSGQQNPGDGGVTFATYTRDSATGLNYADQRYYATGWGRFASPDPGGRKTATPSRPSSWNRYAYTEGDPVNFADPAGLYLVDCVWDGGCANILANSGNYGGGWGSTSGGAFIGGILSSDEGANEAVYNANVMTHFNVQSGVAIANGVLAANGGNNTCANLFSLNLFGTTLQALSSQVTFAYGDLGESDLFAETFDPNDPDNPNPGHYTIEFNNTAGNPNIDAGPYGAADTLIHELLHLASMMYGSFAVPIGWSDQDGGDDVTAQQAQAWNQWLTKNGCNFY